MFNDSLVGLRKHPFQVSSEGLICIHVGGKEGEPLIVGVRYHKVNPIGDIAVHQLSGSLS